MLQQNWLTLTKAKYVKIHFKQNKTKQIRGRIQIGSNSEQTVVDLGYSDDNSVVNALTIASRSFKRSEIESQCSRQCLCFSVLDA